MKLKNIFKFFFLTFIFESNIIFTLRGHVMNFIKKWTDSSLILKIAIGLVIGAVLGVVVPNWTIIGFPGELFVSALKAIAPILVFVLVASAISKARSGIGSRFRTVICSLFVQYFLISHGCDYWKYIIPGHHPSY
jgi:Na+/serine symporter